MRQFLLAALLTLSAVPVAWAHDPYGDGVEQRDAYIRTLEAALLEAGYRHRFEHASQVRRLRSEALYSEARIDTLRRRLVEYDSINRFGTGNALGLTADRTRLDLRREEMIRRDLQDQMLLAQRSRRRSRQVHAMAVERATVQATRRAARGEPSITIVNH